MYRILCLEIVSKAGAVLAEGHRIEKVLHLIPGRRDTTGLLSRNLSSFFSASALIWDTCVTHPQTCNPPTTQSELRCPLPTWISHLDVYRVNECKRCAPDLNQFVSDRKWGHTSKSGYALAIYSWPVTYWKHWIIDERSDQMWCLVSKKCHFWVW